MRMAKEEKKPEDVKKLQQILEAREASLDKKHFVTVGTYTTAHEIIVKSDRISVSPDFVLALPLQGESKKFNEKLANSRRGALFNALIRVINPFPLSRIKTCQRPDCGDYFFQKTTKSKGDFCSPRCQSWARANRWRQNHRDDYNKYHRDRRTKAKEDQVEVKCHSCRFHQSVGSINDIIQGVLPDVKKCPTCGGMLLHFIRTWENGKWVEGAPLGSFEWEEFLKDETLRRED